MDKKELPIWIKAIGSIGLIIDAFAVWVLILYLLNEYCEHFLKVLLCILCGLFMLAGFIYLVWLIVRKYELTKIKDDD